MSSWVKKYKWEVYTAKFLTHRYLFLTNLNIQMNKS